MIIRMETESRPDQRAAVLDRLRALGYETHVVADGGAPIIGANGKAALAADVVEIQTYPGVQQATLSSKPYMLAQRSARPMGTVVRAGNVEFGDGEPVLIAGPCVVEDRESTLAAAKQIQAIGGSVLRGGAYKPRTSPYAFQGLGEEGLAILAEARKATGLPVVTEVMEPEQVDVVAGYADMLQIGSRNMANFPLLRRAAAAGKPILLKRGFSATIDEWLMAAEYLLAGGNDQVVLCERGIRGFDPATRFTLDLNVVPLVKERTHLPVIVDPSHGTGIRSLVPPMALAAIAAGADGLIIEAHLDPDNAKCDADQSISMETLRELVGRVWAVSAALGASNKSKVYETVSGR
jgi:3-deoxy-7-phosphoheptulonate synthase